MKKLPKSGASKPPRKPKTASKGPGKVPKFPKTPPNLGAGYMQGGYG